MIFFFLLVSLAIAIRFPRYIVPYIIVLLPSYLLRATVAGIPTTALEVSIYGAAIGLTWLLITKQQRWNFIAITRWTWGLLLAWAISWVLATIFSINTIDSLGAMKAWFIDPLLVVAMASILTRSVEDRLRIVQSLILSGSSVAIVGLIQFFGFHSLLQDGRLSSYYYPVANYAAMIIGPILILTIGALGSSLLPRRWLLAALLLAAALVLTMSYGGFLAVAVSGVFLVLLLSNKKTRNKILLSGVVIGLLFVAVLTQTKNFDQHFSPDRSSGVARKQIWVTSWAIISQHPIFGIGLNTFEQAYRLELPKHYFPPLEWLVAQPHNLYLALWLETGLLGLLSFFALFGYHAWYLVKKFFRQSEHRAIAICSLAVLIQILVHGLLDTPYFKNDLAILFLIIAILPWLGQEKNITTKE